MTFYYVYILRIIKHNSSSVPELFYTGQTHNLWKRLNEHRTKRGSREKAFVRKIDGSKILVYVEYANSVYDALKKEIKIKSLNRIEKEDLINSDKNQLVNYFPQKVIVLKKKDNPNEQIPIYYVPTAHFIRRL